MFTNILLAVDGSEASLGAARVAGRLAGATGAAVRLLTVHDAPGPMLGEPAYSDALHHALAEADEHLVAAAAVVVEAGGPDPSRDRNVGHAADEILVAADTGGHDLIVLGNRGRGRIAGALLGSVSTAVASRAKVPVLIVPHHAA
jgi:nucleotide-binding universal stress UspA family protein